MNKEIKFNSEAKELIKKGIDTLTDAVAVTMGPKGRNVIIEREDLLPHITKDGVTVAKNITLENQYENIGAQLVKEVAIKTANEAGDGTTSASVLAREIYNRGLEVLKEGINPILLKKELDNYAKKISSYIVSSGITINGDMDKIQNIATISSNNDVEMGQIIATAIQKATEDGVIIVEETTNSETTVEVVEGLQVDKGYLHHYFMTDPVKMICEFENPMILLYDKKINKLSDIYHILEMSVKNSAPIVLVADDYESEVLSTLITNNMRGALKVCAIKSPGFGQSRTGLMEDLAVLTGATYIREELGLTLDKVTINDLGSCAKFQASKTDSLFIGGMGNPEDLEFKIRELRSILANTESIMIKESVQERLAKLSGGVVIIKVGAFSEMELKEKHDRIDDALCATRSALAEGIVPGAGSTYIRASYYLQNLENEFKSIEAEKAFSIIVESLKMPFIQLCLNAGYTNSEIKQMLYYNLENNKGINLLDGKLYDLVEEGIIDPVKVQRCAFENAVNIASLFLTTDCIIINKK